MTVIAQRVACRAYERYQVALEWLSQVLGGD
jgi:hypothetical protein